MFPIVYLARHGETAWMLSGQYTGLTDLPLTERGKRNARRLEERLRGLSFTRVFTSPLQRARRTCELAGFGAVAEIDSGFGSYQTMAITRVTHCRNPGEAPRLETVPRRLPKRESPAQAAARADRVVSRIRAVLEMCCFFPAGISFGVSATRWIGLEVTAIARRFLLSTASLSAVGYDKVVPTGDPVVE